MIEKLKMGIRSFGRFHFGISDIQTDTLKAHELIRSTKLLKCKENRSEQLDSFRMRVVCIVVWFTMIDTLSPQTTSSPTDSSDV